MFVLEIKTNIRQKHPLWKQKGGQLSTVFSQKDPTYIIKIKIQNPANGFARIT